MSVKTWGPLARWLAPVSVLVAVSAGAFTAMAIRNAVASGLPTASPAALLADVRASGAYAASGTISERADLGIPDAFGAGADHTGAADPDVETGFDSLIAGSHTLRAWYDGPSRERVALLGALSESDLIRNGSNVWIWSSRDNSARHATLPERPSDDARATAASLPEVLATLPGALESDAGVDPATLGSQLPKTPQAAATALVSALGGATSATLDAPVTVAGRLAYSLTVAPKSLTSLIGAIRIAIDGRRHVPLRVQVYAKAYSTPAFEVGYTQIAFERPDQSVFTFNPPPGATVTPMRTAARPAAEGPTIIGSGWTAVMVARLPDPPATASLPAIDGTFGPGRLLETRLVTALLLNDGQVIFGAIEPTALISTASAQPRRP